MNLKKVIYKVGNFFGKGYTKVKNAEQFERILLGDIQNPLGKYNVPNDVFKSVAKKSSNTVTIPHGVNVRLTGEGNLGDITVTVQGKSSFLTGKGIGIKSSPDAAPDKIAGKIDLYGESKPIIQDFKKNLVNKMLNLQ